MFKVNIECFSKAEKPTDKSRIDLKKLNLKIHKVDVTILDALATKDCTSRAQILNKLIDKILFDALNELDIQSQKVIADLADSLIGVDEHSGWVSDIANHNFPNDSLGLLDNAIFCAENDNEPTDKASILEILTATLKEKKISYE